MLNILVSIASFIKKQCVRKLIKQLQGLQLNRNNSSKTIKIYLLHPAKSYIADYTKFDLMLLLRIKKVKFFNKGNSIVPFFSSHNMFKKKTSMIFILLILWFNKSGDFVVYRMTSAYQKSSPQSKKRLWLTNPIHWFCW